MNPLLRRWTPAEVRLIGKLPDEEVARRTGHTLESVQSKRVQMGVRLRLSRRPWTWQEERLLGKKSDTTVARVLGRSRADVLAVAFREADRLWMQDPRGVRADLVRKGNSYSTRQDRVAQAHDNVESFREERSKYATFPGSDFIDTETLFRTKTGHGIFGRLRSYWECDRLLADWLAVKTETDE